MFLKIYQNDERIKNKKNLIERIFYIVFPFNFYPFMILYNNKSKGDIKLNTEVK